jgi:hypothetical protein
VLEGIQVQLGINYKLGTAWPHKADLLVSGCGPHRLQGSTSDLVVALRRDASKSLHVNLEFTTLSALCAWVLRGSLVLRVVVDLFLALMLLYDILVLSCLWPKLLLDLELHVPQVADVVGESLVRWQLSLTLKLPCVWVCSLAYACKRLSVP